MTAIFHWNSFALPWGVIGVALVVLAVLIYRRQRASRVAMLFCAMLVLVSVWFIAFAAMFLSRAAGAAFVFARVGLVAIALLPAAIYDFTLTALRLYTARRRIIFAAWAIGAVFAMLAVLTRTVIAGVDPHDWGFYPDAGPLLGSFLLFFFGVLAAQIAEGTAEFRRTPDRQRRRRIARLMASFIVVYVGTIDFVPMFGVPMRPVGFLAVLGFVGYAWTSIRRHRFPVITAARASREILDTMADALFVIDADGTIRVVNRAVHDLLGYSDADLLGRSIDNLEKIDTEHTITRALHDLARRGAIRDQERLLRHKDGHSVDASLSISPVRENDVQQGAVLIARDIGERKRALAELHEAMRRLEQSNRELEDFAYVASHDLQEPLRKIQAFGDLLKSKHAAALPDDARDYIQRMKAAAGRMQILINDLLSFSRVTTKAQPFVPVDLTAIAREVAHDLEIRAHESGGHVVVGDLPSIEADPLQMRQLLQNLAGNALKFHKPDVPPIVEIRGETSDGRCRITVSDNGIGFEPKYAERIFTMFERLHGRGRYEGTGIGLAICRKIAERHGGEITATSTPGEGATFVVTLPVTQQHFEQFASAD